MGDLGIAQRLGEPAARTRHLPTRVAVERIASQYPSGTFGAVAADLDLYFRGQVLAEYKSLLVARRSEDIFHEGTYVWNVLSPKVMAGEWIRLLGWNVVKDRAFWALAPHLPQGVTLTTSDTPALIALRCWADDLDSEKDIAALEVWLENDLPEHLSTLEADLRESIKAKVAK